MWLSAARDIAIIVLAIESLVIGALLIFLLYQIYRLVSLLRSEIKPLLDSVNTTADTVRGTTDFVSDNVVKPVVRARSFIAGVDGAVKALVRPRRARSPE